jgi:hypothetical protein
MLSAPAPLGQTSVSLEGQTPHHEPPALLEGLAPPRAGSRLTQGSQPLAGGSASLEAALDQRCRAHSPNRGIKCSDASMVPGSKANPRHVGLLTPPGNRIPTLFDQPTLCSHPRCYAGAVRDGQRIRNTVPPTLVPPPRHTPRKRTAAPSKVDGDTVERRTTTNQAPAQDNVVTRG